MVAWAGILCWSTVGTIGRARRDTETDQLRRRCHRRPGPGNLPGDAAASVRAAGMGIPCCVEYQQLLPAGGSTARSESSVRNAWTRGISPLAGHFLVRVFAVRYRVFWSQVADQRRSVNLCIQRRHRRVDGDRATEIARPDGDAFTGNHTGVAGAGEPDSSGASNMEPRPLLESGAISGTAGKLGEESLMQVSSFVCPVR